MFDTKHSLQLETSKIQVTRPILLTPQSKVRPGRLSPSADQEILRILRNQKVRNPVHKIPPTVRIQGNINAA
jgi:hypothetical protein